MPEKKPKSSRDPDTGPGDRADAPSLLHTLLQMTLAVCLLAGLVMGVMLMRRYVERTAVRADQPIHVLLKSRPTWMSDFLAEQIIASVRPMPGSPFDKKLLIEAHHRLASNPWVRQVRQVQRLYDQAPGDTLEIDCDFRTPVALVAWGEGYWLVDAEGVKLPEQYNAQQVPRIVVAPDQSLSIRIIEGVQHGPPQAGQTWPGEDLLAGLGLVKLLYGVPWCQEVVKVNVANYAGRVEPRDAQLVLVTRYATEIRWGRPIDARDFFIEIPPAQKLDNLRRVYEQLGRIDGRRKWLDVRYDRITYPTDEEAHAATQ